MRSRIFIILLLVMGVALAAEEKQATAGALQLPASAVKTDNLTWRYTDDEGSVWTYRQTPFGLVRFKASEEGDTAQKPSPSTPVIQAFDDGDQVRFERKSPFGVTSWTRKKSELTDQEREAWERAQKVSEVKSQSEQEDSSPQE